MTSISQVDGSGISIPDAFPQPGQTRELAVSYNATDAAALLARLSNGQRLGIENAIDCASWLAIEFRGSDAERITDAKHMSRERWLGVLSMLGGVYCSRRRIRNYKNRYSEAMRAAHSADAAVRCLEGLGKTDLRTFSRYEWYAFAISAIQGWAGEGVWEETSESRKA